MWGWAVLEWNVPWRVDGGVLDVPAGVVSGRAVQQHHVQGVSHVVPSGDSDGWDLRRDYITVLRSVHCWVIPGCSIEPVFVQGVHNDMRCGAVHAGGVQRNLVSSVHDVRERDVPRHCWASERVQDVHVLVWDGRVPSRCLQHNCNTILFPMSHRNIHGLCWWADGMHSVQRGDVPGQRRADVVRVVHSVVRYRTVPIAGVHSHRHGDVCWVRGWDVPGRGGFRVIVQNVCVNL